MGPARALEEREGPARALEQREKFRKNASILFKHILYEKSIVFGLQTTCFDSFNEFFSFLIENDAERCRNYLNKSVLDPKRAKLDQKSDHMGPYGPGPGP